MSNLDELFTFLKYESISSDPNCQSEINECAQFLVKTLQGIGIQKTQLIDTPGHPVVLAHHHQSDDYPTVLFYGHYDVQPASPLAAWASPPFEPTIRDGYLFARGAADDKGQVWCHIEAIKRLISNQTPHCNIILLIEGEEEVGSPHLLPVLTRYIPQLKPDICLISDTPMLSADQPSICTSLRGICYIELTVTGAKMDLHSGQMGGPAPNPINALAFIISQLNDPLGHVLVPGFYNDAQCITASSAIPFSDSEFRQTLGIDSTWGSPVESLPTKLWYRPTLDCHGIWGGFTDEGTKTVIPSTASAKLSMRLIPNQSPNAIFNCVKSYIQSITPPGVTVSITHHHGANPVSMDTEHAAFSVAKDAIQFAFGKPPLFTGEGGSIPIVSQLKDSLQCDTILMGFNLPNDNIHGPNERFKLDHYEKGILAASYFYSSLI